MAIGVLALLVLGTSYWMGSYVALYGRRGINFYLLILAIALPTAAMVTVWSETAFQVRTWGSDLFGRTALGWRRVDLAGLTLAAIASGRGASSIVLGDRNGRVMFSERKLGPIRDSVRRGLFEAAQQGRLVLPTELAAVMDLPAAAGASKRGKSGVTGPALAVVGLILLGLIVGLVVAGVS